MRKVIILMCFMILTSSFLPFSSVSDAQPTQNLKGTIRVSGAWALYPMMVKWAEEFRKTHPGVRIDISAGGAGKGIADALAGMVDIGMVSRDIRPEEIKPNTTYVPVVKDAVFPTINTNNPVIREVIRRGFKKRVFADLWIIGKPTSWGEISGTTNRNFVQVYTRSDSCGAAETWAQYLGKKQEDLKGVGVYGDPGLAEAVKRDVLAIGYNNLNYAYDSKTGLPVTGIQIIPIDVNENGKVDPSEDLSTKEKAIKAVMSGSYPAPPARDLYLITKEQFSEPSRTFVRWILTEGQQFVNEVGYIKISQKQIAASLRKLER